MAKLEWPKFITLALPNAQEEVEEQDRSLRAGETVQWYRHFGREFGNFLTKVHRIQQLPFLVFPQLATYVQTNTCTQTCIAALLIIVKT